MNFETAPRTGDRMSVGVMFGTAARQKIYHYLIPRGWDIPSVGDYVVVNSFFGNAEQARKRKEKQAVSVPAGFGADSFSVARIVEVNKKAHTLALKEYARAFSRRSLELRDAEFIANSKTRAQIEEEMNAEIASVVRNKGLVGTLATWNPKITELNRQLCLAVE